MHELLLAMKNWRRQGTSTLMDVYQGPDPRDFAWLKFQLNPDILVQDITSRTMAQKVDQTKFLKFYKKKSTSFHILKIYFFEPRNV